MLDISQCKSTILTINPEYRFFFSLAIWFFRILANDIKSLVFARYHRSVKRPSSMLISYMRLLTSGVTAVSNSPCHLLTMETKCIIHKRSTMITLLLFYWFSSDNLWRHSQTKPYRHHSYVCHIGGKSIVTQTEAMGIVCCDITSNFYISVTL